MAHFAEIGEDGLVLRVIVVANSDIIDSNGNESEEMGINICQNALGGNWVQTSYNARSRKNYAGIGFTYDEARDAFIPPKPFPSWILNEQSCIWNAPVEKPIGDYTWDENELNWKEVTNDAN